MKITVPERFEDEYWEKPVAVRAGLSTLAYTLTNSVKDASARAEYLRKEGWSEEFSNWALDQAQRLGPEFELHARMGTPEYDQSVEQYAEWKVSKDHNRKVARWLTWLWFLNVAILATLYVLIRNDSYDRDPSLSLVVLIQLFLHHAIYIAAGVFIQRVKWVKFGWFMPPIILGTFPILFLVAPSLTSFFFLAMYLIWGVIVEALYMAGTLLFLPDRNMNWEPTKPADYEKLHARLRQHQQESVA